MTLFSRFRGYGLLTVTLLIFTVSVFFSVDKMLKEQSSLIEQQQENIIRATTQTEIELFRLLDALVQFGARNPDIKPEDVSRRFDIFLSQFQGLRQGRFGETLYQIEGAEQTLNSMSIELDDIEPTVIFLGRGDSDTAKKIEDRLRALTQPIHTLGIQASQFDEERRSQRRKRLNDVYFELIIYFAGIMLSGSVLVFFLFRGMRRARRLLEERERTEERLRDSEGRFRDFASSSSDWLWETDDRLRFTYFSKGYLEKIGVNAVAILGKTFLELSDGQADGDAWRSFQNSLEIHEPFREFSFDMKIESSEARHIKVSGVPNFDTERNFKGYRGTGTDITAQVEAETEAECTRTLLAEAVEALAEGFAMFDPSDRLVLCNSKFREMYPQSADLIRPGIGFEDMMRAAVQRGQFSVARGEEEAWLEMRMALHRGDQGSLEQRMGDGRWLKVIEQRLANGWTVGTRIDISDLKQREETLRREALIWEQMHDGVMITDLVGNITNWNPAAEQMFGYTAAEILGRKPSVLRGDSDNDFLTRRVLEEVGRQGRWAGEVGFHRRDKSKVICETVVAPLRTEADDIIAIIWVIHDVTLRKRSEQELRGAKDAAEQANLAKSQFLATMSHEIRTPMNGVLGMINLLLDTRLQDEQRSYAETARESGEALLTIIDDILDFSKMEAGKMVMESTEFELRHVVEGVVELLAPRAQAKEVDVSSFISPDVPTVVMGDPGRFRQVLLNLAGNAVKFTEKGGVSVNASLDRISGYDAVLRIKVTDTGVGIPDDQKENLFNEFTQVDPSYTRKYGGTGLGLAISKKLSELMGGEIGLDSEFGNGSTFWFTARLGLNSDAVSTPGWGEGLKGLRALIVDDSATNLVSYREQVAPFGIEYEIRDSAESALACLGEAVSKGAPFDVMIVDKSVSGGAGETISELVRRDDAIRDTRLILVTPLSDRSRTDDFLAAGFDAHLTKPVRQITLFTKLAEVTDRPAALEVIETRIEDRQEATIEISPEVAAHARLLLAEDSKVNQVVALAMLDKAGYRVDAVNNGREAYEAVQSGTYDLILMDVSMPEMDGFDATIAIRNLPGDVSRTPIIAMTAHAMEGDREKCLAAGMNDYVSKPVDRFGLLSTVAKWLGGEAPVESVSRVAQRARAAGRNDAGNASADPAALNGDNGRDSTLDLDIFAQLAEDTTPQMLDSLIRTFIAETAGRLRRMTEAAPAADLGVLEQEAHALKSSSGAFGAWRLQDQALAMEMAARQGQRDEALGLIRPVQLLALEASQALIERVQNSPRAAQ
ncbi:MAG: response regulator [Proteobacteria bacterium]|nr:response regulator [Pseudomonadota bacterium]